MIFFCDNFWFGFSAGAGSVLNVFWCFFLRFFSAKKGTDFLCLLSYLVFRGSCIISAHASKRAYKALTLIRTPQQQVMHQHQLHVYAVDRSRLIPSWLVARACVHYYCCHDESTRSIPFILL
ncbi:unnamed protein product, partial [Ectocarpus sp. 12 AP-2014]